MKARLKYRILFCLVSGLILFAIPRTGFAQQNNSQLAFAFFRNNDFEKASILFLDLYKEKNNTYYRTYYIQSLVQNDQLDEAEKFIRKELRKNKNDIDLKIDHAYIIEMQGDKENANKLYHEIIEASAITPNSVKSLANSFIRKRKYELAEETYLTGRKRISNEDFYYELANLYAMQRKYDKMVDAYLDLLNKNSSYMNSVQTRLQNLAANDIDGSLNPTLESALIKRIQSNSSNPVFTELLIWQYVQTGEFEMAIQHASALDKRFKELGKRLYDLGELASDNGNPEIAKTCFDKVYEYGKTSPWYFKAKLIELNNLYLSATSTSNPDKEELQDLETLIRETAGEAPRKLKYPLIKLQAQVQAFYLDKADEALMQLDSAMNTFRLSPEELAEFSLLQGDIYLIDGNPWEATLIYAKVEQENKENPIGSEAKFRKAKLAYYTGQFEWAKAQLDVLKASTSKLISNDSFELSLFISENSTEDSLQTALEMFARADLLQTKRDYAGALKVLDSVQSEFPTNSLNDDVLFRKAMIREELGDYTAAIDLYNLVATDHSWEMLADNALINMARIQHYKLKDKESAMASYTQLLLNHKGSIFIEEARNAIRELRGDFSTDTSSNEIPD